MLATNAMLHHFPRQHAITAALAMVLMPALSLASPFPTRDQNPLLAGFGLPMPMPAHIDSSGEWDFAAAFNWGNSAIVQSSDREMLLVDAETRELRLTLGRALNERWALQFELPYRYTGAGTLDGFIDSWHDFFGLPQGMRPLLPQDQFRIAYERDATSLIDMESSVTGLGDISAGVGYQMFSGPQGSAAAWLSVKLPTGDADKLTGSGAVDVTIAVAGEHRLAERWSVFGQAAATWLGEGDLFAAQQRNVVWSALAGVQFTVWRGLAFKMQFDARSAAFDDTDLDYLGSAGILTIGGSYRFDSGWLLDFGVSEDVVVDASPDVVFVFGLRYARGK